jgi:hypothetical protein
VQYVICVTIIPLRDLIMPTLRYSIKQSHLAKVLLELWPTLGVRCPPLCCAAISAVVYARNCAVQRDIGCCLSAVLGGLLGGAVKMGAARSVAGAGRPEETAC